MLNCTNCVTMSLNTGEYDEDLDEAVCCSSCSDALLLSASVLFSSSENSALDARVGLWGKLVANVSKSNLMLAKLVFAAARSKSFLNMAPERPNENKDQPPRELQVAFISQKSEHKDGPRLAASSVRSSRVFRLGWVSQAILNQEAYAAQLKRRQTN